jgi:hypothetical protein
MGYARLALVAPLLHFLFSKVLFRGKTGSGKVLGNLDSGSPKLKDIEKEVFLFSQVNPIKLGNM